MTDTLTLQEAALLLGKSTQTVRRLIKKGEVEAQQIQTPQGFQYAVSRTSLAARFPRMVLASSYSQETEEVSPQAVEPEWTQALSYQNRFTYEKANSEKIVAPIEFLENDYYELNSSPVQEKEVAQDMVTSQKFWEFVHSAHKEKLMLITILERLQAQLEHERRQPKTWFQWIGERLEKLGSFLKTRH